MLTRFIRTQLVVFTLASIIGIAAVVVGTCQAPTLLDRPDDREVRKLPSTGGPTDSPT